VKEVLNEIPSEGEIEKIPPTGGEFTTIEIELKLERDKSDDEVEEDDEKVKSDNEKI